MEKNQAKKVLLRTDPFEILENSVLEALVETIEIREYPYGSYVFHQGDPSLDVLFIIAEGLVELVAVNDRGVETVIGLKRSFDFFGETVVFSGHRYPAAARVKESLTCCLVFRRNLEKLMYAYPEFSGFFNALLTERMRLLYEELATGRYGGGAPGAVMNPELFRKRVSDIMAYPAITCRATDLVVTAARTMADKDINAVVALDSENKPRGILTDKNLVRYLIAHQMYPVDTCRVKNVMHSQLIEIAPQAFIGQALVAMMRSKTKHLIVVERGELVGIVSMVDLIKTQSAGTLLLTRDIESQPDLNGLSLVAGEIQNILKPMVEESSDIHEIFDVMSELHERLTRRVIQLSEERMKLAGWGGPPVDYCWINLGSAARYEQVFGTDQDHAIVYADPEPEAAGSCDDYFRRLAESIEEGLSICGFEPCRDGIMASSSEWRKSISGWIAAIDAWFDAGDDPSSENRRIATLLDYRPLWGNVFLGEMLKNRIMAAVRGRIGRMIFPEDAAEYQEPVTFLGTFITEEEGDHKGEMNLKSSVISHLLHGLRILSGHCGIAEPSTRERIRLLTEQGVITKEDGDLFETAFNNLMMLAVRENMKKLKQGKRPDYYIDPYSMRKRERSILKDAFSGVSHLKKILKTLSDNHFQPISQPSGLITRDNGKNISTI